MDESTPVSRHPDSMRRAFLWALLPTLVLFLSAPSVGDAQVTTSITSTTGTGNLGTTITHTGNLYDITGGTRPGNGPNLFHSFGNFSVGGGDIGNFLNTPVNGSLPLTSNILGRVTGGNTSNIYGTIQTTDFGTANLFLVNPSGIVFGPNGSVNVGGSVSFTTAQYLRLFDSLNGVSANFYANPANDGLANSVLAVAPVVDFGFLSPAAYGFLTPPDPSATITVQGSALSVPPSPPGSPGNSISLVGGKVVIQGATLPDGTVQPARLSAPNGTIQLASTASPGEFDVATLQALPNVNGTSFTSFGSTVLAPGSSIDVSGARTVFIKGGQLVLSVNDANLSTSENPAPPDTIALSPGGAIATSNSGVDPGADVQITVGAVQMDGAMIQSINSGDLNGGNISINATTVGLTNGAIIQSSTGLDFFTGTSVGSGTGGNVTVVQGQGMGVRPLDSLALSNGSSILTLTFGPGRAGDLQLTALNLTMENFAQIFTGKIGGDGLGGDVALNVGTLTLMGGSSILTGVQNSTSGLGRGGNVTIQGLQGVGSAAESVTLSGGSSLLTQTFGGSEGGRMAITSKSLTMDGAGTTVNSSSNDVGRGGDIVLSVGQASLSGGATIITQTSSADLNAVEGGTVTLQGLQGAGSKADSVTLSGFGSGIISDTFGAPRSGDVAVHAKTVSLTDGAVIQAGTPFTTAAGGNVTIDADSVGISSGSRIFSRASHLDAGTVTITANTFILDNASIATNTSSEGRGGDVVLNVGSVSLANGAKINSSSSGFEADAGDAGNITIHSGSTVVMNNSSMTAEASHASGGQITITAPEMVRLTNSRISTSVFGGTGSGGNITIDPQFVILQNSQIIAQAFAGSNGNINITAEFFLADPNSVVDASSQLSINAVVVQIVGGRLTPLSQQFSSAAALLLAQRCAADATGQFSSFVQIGRDGVPQVPGALSPSPLSFLETLTSGSLGSSGPNWAAARLGLDSVSFDDSTRFHSACRS